MAITMLPAVAGEDWARTPDSTKHLVITMEQHIAGLEQRIYTSEGNDSINLRDVLHVIRKHWLMIVLTFFSTVIPVAVLTANPTPVYESTATLLVKFGREHIYRPQVGTSAVVVNRNLEAVINVGVQILHSHNLSETVVNSLGAEELYPYLATASQTGPSRLATAIQMFSNNFSAKALPESDVIRVSFRHQNPHMAARALNLAIDLFKEKHLQAFSDPQTTAFLEEKVAAYREKLEQSIEQIKAFQAENTAFFLKSQGEVLFRQREGLETALNGARNQIVGLQEKLLYLNTEKESLAKKTALLAEPEQSRVVTPIKAQLLDLQLTEQKLLGRYVEKHSMVVDVREQIKLVKDFLKEQEATGGKSRFQQEIETDIINTRAEIRFQTSRKHNLEQQLHQLDIEIQNLPLQESKYRDLIRERNINEENYQTYLKRLEEARISEEMDRKKIVNISVIQEGLVPRKPIPSGRRAKIAIAMLLGAAIGLVWAFARESTLSTPRSVETRLGLPHRSIKSRESR